LTSTEHDDTDALGDKMDLALHVLSAKGQKSSSNGARWYSMHAKADLYKRWKYY
jgi:hypothetical protein